MTNPAVEALKPCPLCSGEALVRRSTKVGRKTFFVFCKKCGLEIGLTDARFVTEQKAVEAWNRRAQAEQTPVASETRVSHAKAGRVVNEELWLRIIARLDYLTEMCEQHKLFALAFSTNEDAKALRAAPTVRKEGE